MEPDSTWAGVFYPVVAHWLPTVPKEILLSVLGLLISGVYALFKHVKTKKELANPEPNPLHVAIPAAVGGVIAGVPGLFAAAAGDGLRRAGWAVYTWLVTRFKR